jgi:2-C-methyl-D-erythritol 4-phosphate cytidylyltransferase
MKTAAVIVAAGSGTRFGGPKHNLLLDGVELWRRAADVFEAAGITNVVVVGDVPGGVPGGFRRRDSVQRGLDALPADVDCVLVHDAARPLVTVGLIERLVQRFAIGDVDGVIPAVPLVDTVKRVDGEAVVATVDRSALVSVQTPQAFRLSSLRSAHAVDDADATDDASMVERNGGTVVQVMGDAKNLKITLPDDLVVARAHMKSMADHD